jgi:hypothetical protein
VTEVSWEWSDHVSPVRVPSGVEAPAVSLPALSYDQLVVEPLLAVICWASSTV